MDRYRRLKNKGRALVVLVNGVPALRVQRVDDLGDPLPAEEYAIDVGDLAQAIERADSTLKDLKALLADALAVAATAPAAIGWPEDEQKTPAG